MKVNIQGILYDSFNIFDFNNDEVDKWIMFNMGRDNIAPSLPFQNNIKYLMCSGVLISIILHSKVRKPEKLGAHAKAAIDIVNRCTG